jgi:hypothetical protein
VLVLIRPPGLFLGEAADADHDGTKKFLARNVL